LRVKSPGFGVVFKELLPVFYVVPSYNLEGEKKDSKKTYKQIKDK
jgi:hypothetical protein